VHRPRVPVDAMCCLEGHVLFANYLVSECARRYAQVLIREGPPILAAKSPGGFVDEIGAILANGVRQLFISR
jgi:hypothetical protein